MLFVQIKLLHTCLLFVFIITFIYCVSVYHILYVCMVTYGTLDLMQTKQIKYIPIYLYSLVVHYCGWQNSLTELQKKGKALPPHYVQNPWNPAGNWNTEVCSCVVGPLDK